MMKILFSLLLVVAPLIFIEAFPQNNPETAEISQVDGFVFDGPIAKPFTVPQRSSTTQTTNTNTNVNRNTNANTNIIPTPSLQFDQCVTSCPVTPEYNPVCGSDNLDYINPGGLGCAQRCGKDVRLLYYGRCSIG